MTSKITPGVSFLGMVVGALLVVAPAGADEVVAELTRDTPIAAYGGVVAWSDYDVAIARYQLVIRRGRPGHTRVGGEFAAAVRRQPGS